MPKIPTPLSDKEIKALKPKAKKFKKCDGRGLYIFVEPSGRKYFAMEYKSPETNQIKRIKIGDYPNTTLAMARDERLKIEQSVKDGIDIKAKAQRDEAGNFKNIALNWLEIKSHSVAPSTLNRDKRLLEMYAFDTLAGKNIADITITEVIAVLKRIENKGSLEATKRLYSLFNQIWQSAYTITPNNIIASINYRYTFKKANVKNYSTLTNPNDVRSFWQNIDSYNGEIRTIYALKFATLTALRPYNVRTAKWSYIDFKNEIMQIPADEMKMRQPFTLPLARQTIRLLKEFKALNFGGEYLFCALFTPNRAMSENTLNVAIRRLGYAKDELVSHGLRAMFSTIANENIDKHGLNYDIIEKCLAHTAGDKVRAAYNRAGNLNQMRTLMQWWADWLDGF